MFDKFNETGNVTATAQPDAYPVAAQANDLYGDDAAPVIQAPQEEPQVVESKASPATLSIDDELSAMAVSNAAKIPQKRKAGTSKGKSAKPAARVQITPAEYEATLDAMYAKLPDLDLPTTVTKSLSRASDGDLSTLRDGVNCTRIGGDAATELGRLLCPMSENPFTVSVAGAALGQFASPFGFLLWYILPDSNPHRQNARALHGAGVRGFMKDQYDALSTTLTRKDKTGLQNIALLFATAYWLRVHTQPSIVKMIEDELLNDQDKQFARYYYRRGHGEEMYLATPIDPVDIAELMEIIRSSILSDLNRRCAIVESSMSDEEKGRELMGLKPTFPLEQFNKLKFNSEFLRMAAPRQPRHHSR